MSKNKIILVVFVVCLSLIMSAAVDCSNNGADEASTTEEPRTVIFTDSAGRQVEVPAEISRIVPSGPMAQIALFALAPDMLVGLSTEWDPAAEQYIDTEYYNLPVLGQFYGKGELNLEEIAKVDPQVIIDIGEAKSTIVEDMDAITEQLGSLLSILKRQQRQWEKHTECWANCSAGKKRLKRWLGTVKVFTIEPRRL